MNKYSIIFYELINNKFKSEFEKYLYNFNNKITYKISNLRNEQFKYFCNLFLNFSLFEEDFNKLIYFISIKNDMIFSDHTTAKRLINIINYYNNNNNNNNYNNDLKNKLNFLLDIHINLLLNDNFLNLGNNHGFDQLKSILYYHDNINKINTIIKYENLINDYIKSCFTNDFFHIENSGEYHYYALTSLYNFINDDLKNNIIKNLFLILTPNLKILDYGDTKSIYLKDIYKNKYLKNDKTFLSLYNKININYYNLFNGINYLKSGFLILKDIDIYFFIKSAYYHKYHHHYDNNSIHLYYKKEKFFIDCGLHSYEYNSFGRKYVVSPYAHNLFVLNNNKLIDNNIYKCYSSFDKKNNTYNFYTYYYKNIEFIRKIKYIKNNKLIQINDEINNIPKEYKYYYILYHLNPKTNYDIINNNIHLKINNSEIKLTNFINNYIIDYKIVNKDKYDNMKISLASFELNNLTNIPTLVLKYINNINNRNNLTINFI